MLDLAGKVFSLICLLRSDWPVLLLTVFIIFQFTIMYVVFSCPFPQNFIEINYLTSIRLLSVFPLKVCVEA